MPTRFMIALRCERHQHTPTHPHGWDRFGNVNDLPTPQTEQAIQAEKSRRYRRANPHPRSRERCIGRVVLRGSRAKCYTIFNTNIPPDQSCILWRDWAKGAFRRRGRSLELLPNGAPGPFSFTVVLRG
jgi:hypothetical protein